jgi:hypothetical protein
MWRRRGPRELDHPPFRKRGNGPGRRSIGVEPAIYLFANHLKCVQRPVMLFVPFRGHLWCYDEVLRVAAEQLPVDLTDPVKWLRGGHGTHDGPTPIHDLGHSLFVDG